MTPNTTYKVVIVGDSGVGKSNLLVRYIDNVYSDLFISTIGVDFKLKTMNLPDGTNTKLYLWDTAGQERFKTITTAYFRGAMGLVCCFDTTCKATLDNVDYWIRECTGHSISNGDIPIPMVLVGTKADLSYARQVTDVEAREFAAKRGMDYFETSSKNNTQAEVGRVFETITRLIHENHVRDVTVTKDAPTTLQYDRSTKQCCTVQ